MAWNGLKSSDASRLIEKRTEQHPSSDDLSAKHPFHIGMAVLREAFTETRTAREQDARYIADLPDLPGVMAYGNSREEAIAKAQSLALRVLADRLDHGEGIPELNHLFMASS